MKAKILLVDDDSALLDTYKTGLSTRYEVDTAGDGKTALALLRTRGPYAVVLADMNLPGMLGTELLEQVRALSPDTVRMMLTGNSDQQIAVAAVNRGQVSRFLNKPVPFPALVEAVEDGLTHNTLKIHEREILEDTLVGSINLLTDVLAMVARDALGRGHRLRDAMSRFAHFLAAPSRWELELGALLSSIGYTAVPSGILKKITAKKELLPEEASVVARVPQIGRDLLAAIPRLTEVAEIVLYQRKSFDGSGFPSDGVAGEVIPLGARILTILNDRFDLEETGEEPSRVREIMFAWTGRYDPRLLDQCFKCFPDKLAAAVRSAKSATAVQASQLKPRDMVVSDIVTKGGVTLVPKGSVLTAMMIARLDNFKLLNELQEPLQVRRGAPD